MDIIETKKYDLRNQPFLSLYGATVLLAEPEAESSELYARRLAEVHMKVVRCPDLSEVLSHIEASTPDVVIINPSIDVRRGLRAVAAVRGAFPAIPLITVGVGLPDDHLDAIMKSGVSYHLDRRLSRPRDLLVALEQIFSS